MKILIIDDSLTMRNLVKKKINNLELKDIEIVEAKSGEHALEILKEDPTVDVILCDTCMPGLGMLKTIQKIREDKDKEDLPVVLCTSIANKATVLEGLKAGANDYMIKPFRNEDVKKKVGCYYRDTFARKRKSKRKNRNE
jgi:CheY-like chemotaxis protein